MSVDITHKERVKKVPTRKLRKTAESILAFLKHDRADLSLAFVDNEEIQELNARYRNKNEPTDVLSFPSGEGLPVGMQILGDVVISVEKAEEQARKRGKPLDQEIESLLIHGILHLLGYDHERSEKEAKVMRGLEKKVSRALCRTGKLRV